MNHSIPETRLVFQALENGRLKQAKKLIQYKVKHNPEKQAYRLGVIIGAFVDPDGFYCAPQHASTLLSMFDPNRAKRRRKNAMEYCVGFNPKNSNPDSRQCDHYSEGYCAFFNEDCDKGV